MAIEAFAIAGASLATIIIAKIKFYIKKNGDWQCGCGFMDKPLVDDDEIEIKQFELSDNVRGIYVKPKGKHHLHHIDEVEEEEEEE